MLCCGVDKCGVDEGVKLNLMITHCLPIITYSIGALVLNPEDIRCLGVCWNDIFRCVYGFHRWESVTAAQMFSGCLSFAHIYSLSRWNFIDCIPKNQNVHVPSPVSVLWSYIDPCNKVIYNIRDKYNYHGLSRYRKKEAVLLNFTANNFLHG